MKKKVFSLIVTFIMTLTLIALIAVPASAAPLPQYNIGDTQGLYIKVGPKPSGPNPQTTLDWQQEVGYVRVYKNADGYYIGITGHENWYILEASFDYGVPLTFNGVAGSDNEDGIPLTPNKQMNPIPGKFTYKANLSSPSQDVTIGPIQIPDNNEGEYYVFILHAVVGQSIGGDGCSSLQNVQTAWGDCQVFPSKKWAKYWPVTLPSGANPFQIQTAG